MIIQKEKWIMTLKKKKSASKEARKKKWKKNPADENRTSHEKWRNDDKYRN